MRHTARTAASTTHEPARCGGPYWVTFLTPDREVTVSVAADEYLLEAAAEAGLDLPSTCLQGWCLSCAAKLERGSVDQGEAFRLYAEDEAAGFVLLCSAYPTSDLRLRTYQKRVMQAHRRAHGLPAPGA